MDEIALRQAILHGLIAATLVEVVLLAWRIRAPESRLAFWLIALACPFLLPPLFLLVAPFRATDAFQAGVALFASRRWADVRLAGVGVDTIVFDALAACGLLLFLRDGLPVATAAWRGRRAETTRGAARESLLALVASSAVAAGVRTPSVVELRTDAPILLVRGVRRHTLVCSQGALARLSGEELRAALAHELAHVRFADPLAGWLLMAARLVMCWNPAVQLLGRAIVQEMERRADAAAMRLADGPSFVSALRTLIDRPEAAVEPPVFGEMIARVHRAQVRARLAWAVEPRSAPGFLRGRLALVATTLAALLFFVV